jgi:hypothetical protein
MAKALLKVAALVPPGRSETLAMAGLHREGTIEARVRALVARADAPAAASGLGDSEAAEGAGRALWLAGGLVLLAAAAAYALSALPVVHQRLERLVHLF